MPDLFDRRAVLSYIGIVIGRRKRRHGHEPEHPIDVPRAQRVGAEAFARCRSVG